MPLPMSTKVIQVHPSTSLCVVIHVIQFYPIISIFNSFSCISSCFIHIFSFYLSFFPLSPWCSVMFNHFHSYFVYIHEFPSISSKFLHFHQYLGIFIHCIQFSTDSFTETRISRDVFMLRHVKIVALCCICLFVLFLVSGTLQHSYYQKAWPYIIIVL